MDDIENDAVLLLCLLDQAIFPHFLEWNKDSQDLSKWILFLLQTDFLKFNGLIQNHGEDSKVSLAVSYVKQANERYPLLTSSHIQSLERLCSSRIPLKAALSPVCQLIWKTIVTRTRRLTSSKHWGSMQNKIVTETVTVELDFILENETYRRYFDRYLQSDPSELGALQCMMNARRLLHRVEPFVRRTLASDTSNSGKKEEVRTSIFSWRSTMKAVNMAGSGASGKKSADQSPSVTAYKDEIITFTDSLEVLKLVLFGMRTLQKEFFPSVGAAPIATSASNQRNSFGHSKTPNNLSSHRNSMSNVRGGSTSGAGIFEATNICAGLSEALRVEILATLSQYATIKTVRDVDAMDARFGSTAAKSLYDLVSNLEQETYHFLQHKYTGFLQSSEFVKLFALRQCEVNPHVIRYLSRQHFLHGKVKREELLHWATAQAKGVLYLPLSASSTSQGSSSKDEYDKVSTNNSRNVGSPPRSKPYGHQESKGASKHPSENHLNESESINYAINAPPMFAMHFSVCLPEFTALNQDNLPILPHRMRLWASESALSSHLRKYRLSSSGSTRSSPQKPPTSTTNSTSNANSASNMASTAGPRRAFFPPTPALEPSPASNHVHNNSGIAFMTPVADSHRNVSGNSSVAGHGESSAESNDDVGEGKEGSGKPVNTSGKHNKFTRSTILRELSDDSDYEGNNRPVRLAPGKALDEAAPAADLHRIGSTNSSDATSAYSSDVQQYDDSLMELSVRPEATAARLPTKNAAGQSILSAGTASPIHPWPEDLIEEIPAKESQTMTKRVSHRPAMTIGTVDDDDYGLHTNLIRSNHSLNNLLKKQPPKNDSDDSTEDDDEDDVGDILSLDEVDENGLPLDLDQDAASAAAANARKRVTLLELSSDKIDRGMRQKILHGVYPKSTNTSQDKQSNDVYNNVGHVGSLSLSAPPTPAHDDILGRYDDLSQQALFLVLMNQLWRCNLHQDVDLELEQDTHHFVLLKSRELQAVYQHLFGTSPQTRHGLGQVYLSVFSRLVTQESEIHQALQYIQPQTLLGGNYTHLGRSRYRKIVHISLVYAPVSPFHSNATVHGFSGGHHHNIFMQMQQSSVSAHASGGYRSCLRLMQEMSVAMQAVSGLPASSSGKKNGGDNRTATPTPSSRPPTSPPKKPAGSVKKTAFSVDNEVVVESNAPISMQVSDAKGSACDDKKTLVLTGNNKPPSVFSFDSPAKLRSSHAANRSISNKMASDSDHTMIVRPHKIVVFDDDATHFHKALQSLPMTKSSDEYSHKPQETLYDLYLRCPPPSSDTCKQPEQLERDIEEEATRRVLAITKHCGICDFAIAGVLSKVGARLMLQILLLLLTDRKVLLLSSSPTLLSKMFFVIQRLIWPFHLIPAVPETDRNSYGNTQQSHRQPPPSHLRERSDSHFTANDDYDEEEEAAANARAQYEAYYENYHSHDPLFSFVYSAEELLDYFGIVAAPTFTASHPGYFYLQNQRTRSHSNPVSNVASPLYVPGSNQANSANAVLPSNTNNNSSTLLTSASQSSLHSSSCDALANLPSLRPFSQLSRQNSNTSTPTNLNSSSVSVISPPVDTPTKRPSTTTTPSMLLRSLSRSFSNIPSPAMAPLEDSSNVAASEQMAENASLRVSSDSVQQTQLPAPVADAHQRIFSRVVCVDVRAYHIAQRMLAAAQTLQTPFTFPLDYEDDRYCVFDLDTAQQHLSANFLHKNDASADNAANSNGTTNSANNTQNNSANAPTTLQREYGPLDLRNPLLYQTANFNAVRDLLQRTQDSAQQLFDQLRTQGLALQRKCQKEARHLERHEARRRERQRVKQEASGRGQDADVTPKSNTDSSKSRTKKSDSHRSSKRRNTLRKTTFRASPNTNTTNSNSHKQMKSATTNSSSIGSIVQVLTNYSDSDDSDEDDDYHRREGSRARNSSSDQNGDSSPATSKRSITSSNSGSESADSSDEDSDSDEDDLLRELKADDGDDDDDAHGSGDDDDDDGDALDDEDVEGVQKVSTLDDSQLFFRSFRRQSSSSLSSPSSRLFSMLASPKNNNNGSIRSNTSSSRRHQLRREQLLERQHTRWIAHCLAQDAAVRRSNGHCEAAFHTLWMQLLLQALPAHLSYEPSSQILGCDMQSVLAQLMVRNHGHHMPSNRRNSRTQRRGTNNSNNSNNRTRARSNTTGSGSQPGGTQSGSSPQQSTNHKQHTTFTNNPHQSTHNVLTGQGLYNIQGGHAAQPHRPSMTLGCTLPYGVDLDHDLTVNGYTCQEIQRLAFGDFLTLYNDHTARAGISLCHAWYAECLVGLSPALLDLLHRHGEVLRNQAF